MTKASTPVSRPAIRWMTASQVCAENTGPATRSSVPVSAPPPVRMLLPGPLLRGSEPAGTPAAGPVPALPSAIAPPVPWSRD